MARLVLDRLFRRMVSVRAKLFFGFFAMAALMTGLGGYSVYALGNAGDVVRTTFDRPLMAINHSRAAGQRFTELTLDIKRGILSEGEIDARLKSFREDLEVAKERSLSERAGPFFQSVEAKADTYLDVLRADPDRASDVKASIIDDLEIIVELQSGEAFRARESALDRVARLERWAVSTIGLALFLTVMLSGWLAVTIIGPLRQAADAAKRISAGDFAVDIPAGRADETGILLDAMTSMRDNIRRRMANEVRARDVAEDRLAESLDNSRDAVVLANPGGRIVLANSRTAAIFPELANARIRDCSVTTLFALDGYPLFGRYARQKAPPGETRIASHEGRWMRVNASRTREGGLLLIWTDITQDMIAQNQLRIARDEALAAARAKTDFLASMSHELRTPLNAVIGFSEIIGEERLGALGQPQYKDMAAHISRSGHHLLAIVEDVLRVASGESEADAREKGPVDLAETVAFCVHTLQSGAKTAGVSLRQTEPTQGVAVFADTLHMEQICLNLLNNAVKFTPKGGSVEASVDTHIAGAVRLVVRDTGIGIPASKIDHVRQPSRRWKRAPSARMTGSVWA